MTSSKAGRNARCAKPICIAALTVWLALPAFAQKERILYSFTNHTDGITPYEGLIADTNGNLYGSTYGEGARGTVFKLSPPTTGSEWSETTLHTFNQPGDGQNVLSVLTLDGVGNLYGATVLGGAYQVGTIFQLVPPASGGGAWTENILHNFSGTTDGVDPWGGVIFDRHGHLFGTTNGNFTTNWGTIYELSPPTAQGGEWTETILYRFKGTTDGCGPHGKLMFGNDGALYGTAVECGGTQKVCFNGCGTIFRLAPPTVAGGPWTETTIYNFQGNADGEWPQNGLVHDAGGNLYGSTWQGGLCAQTPPGCGTVFKLSPPAAGGNWTESVLYSFTGGNDGQAPLGGVIVDRYGNLFGTTNLGGDRSCATGSGCGTVFELLPPSTQGGPWIEITLHAFTGGIDGANPLDGLTFVRQGEAVYGVTSNGGGCSFTSAGCGAIFEVVP